MLTDKIRRDADRWIGSPGPGNHVAVSTRARYARNVSGHPFAPHATPEALARLADDVGDTLRELPPIDQFSAFPMETLSPVERHFLRESRLISPEMETLTQGRGVYVAPDCLESILVNEEDHLRIQHMVPGLQLEAVMERLDATERRLGERLTFAWSRRLGFLTACPTNTGTGLRISVMLHLPALGQTKQIETLLQSITPFGLTVRGFYGENSEFQGDFYQISNEITLGKSTEEIRELLARILQLVVEREEKARESLFRLQRTAMEDKVWRAWAVLAHARLIGSSEALDHLSHLRLGIAFDILPQLAHAELNRLILDIQPAHLQLRHGDSGSPEGADRNEVRARLLRGRLGTLSQPGDAC